jgi:hypothetical protein
MQPWRDWYHVTLHTYGTWLRGDPRGWRSRHHREHIDGDYKRPPPKGKYDALFEYSKSLMKRDPVRIESELREFVLDALIDKLLENRIDVAIGSLDGIHGHLLLQCSDHNPRHWIGLAKKNASHLVRQLSLLEPGGLWAGDHTPSRSPTAATSIARSATSATTSFAARSWSYRWTALKTTSRSGRCCSDNAADDSVP